MKLDISPMLNAYPDSMGGTLHDIVQLLARPEFENVFGSFYILPSVFNTDLDRGFSVIDYTLNRELAGPQDMEGLKALGLKLKLDFILNHASVLSPQFQDLLKNGKSSAYRDFFIDWNDFWQGCGSMTEQGYIQPEAKYLEKMLFRKPGLPILMARMPDGTEEPYWNTFYQQVDYLRPTVQQLMQISGHSAQLLRAEGGILHPAALAGNAVHPLLVVELPHQLNDQVALLRKRPVRALQHVPAQLAARLL